MITANTLQVRNFVKNVLDISTLNTWTDKCNDESMRLVAFQISNNFFTEIFKQEITKMFRDVGYDNRIKITNHRCATFLRIKAKKA